MDRIILLLAIVLSSSVSRCSATTEECCAEEARTNFSISVIRNTTGEWFSPFAAEKIIDETTDRVDLDVEHTIERCGNRRIVRIKGVLRDASTVSHADETIPNGTKYVSVSKPTRLPKICCCNEVDVLRFYEKKGKNAVISNYGRTAYRKNPTVVGAFATLITHRPLKEEELFEVVVDNTIAEWEGFSFVMGVITSPVNIESVFSSFYSKNEKWRLLYDRVNHDSSTIKSNYGVDMTQLKVGDRVGVKVRSNGDLHFFFNGKDMGPAASNVPTSVYGMVDLINYVEQISIVA